MVVHTQRKHPARCWSRSISGEKTTLKPP